MPEVDLVVGVSAGGCHAASYLSKQYKRAFHSNVDYLNDKDYISFRNLIKTGSIFGMDLMFNKIPNELYLYDYDTFNKSKSIGSFLKVSIDAITVAKASSNLNFPSFAKR